MELEKPKKRKEDSEGKRETENNNETVSSLSSVGNRGSEELGIFGLSHPGLHWLASCLWEPTWETIGGTNYKFRSGNEILCVIWELGDGVKKRHSIHQINIFIFGNFRITGKIILADFNLKALKVSLGLFWCRLTALGISLCRQYSLSNAQMRNPLLAASDKHDFDLVVINTFHSGSYLLIYPSSAH